LVAAGIAESVEEIFEYGFGAEEVEITEFEQTWSEEVAAIIISATPLLYGLGFVMLVIEIKTPSFGILGALGALFIVTAFFGQDVAGLAGFEAVLLLLGGMVLIAVEIFVLPGTVIFGLTGILCVLGAMVWSFADVWPVVPEPGQAPVDWRINTASLETGVFNVAMGLVIAFVSLWVIWRFLPKSRFFRHVVHEGHIVDPSPVIAGGGRYVEEKSLPDIGSEGIVVTDLHPVGMVEVDGNHFEATTSVGDLRKGETILVVGYKSYSLLVDKKN
jgi:membrane-bound serine protease (ClpP class)